MSQICDPEPGFVLSWPITKREQKKQRNTFLHRFRSATMALLLATYNGTDRFSTVPTSATGGILRRAPELTLHELLHGRSPGTLKLNIIIFLDKTLLADYIELPTKQ
jgi:hypothetical protein